jgi:hypothetical protein
MMTMHHKVLGSLFARPFVVVLLVAFLAGCGVDYGPMANRSRAQALSFKPPAGQSGIYIIRQFGVIGAAAAWEIDLDADLLGKITVKNYLFATVPPGEHNLRVIYQDDGYTFRTEPDKNYYFQVVPSLTGRVEQLSDDRGRQLVTELSK